MHTQESKQRLFGKCVNALSPNIIAEEKIMLNDKDFTLAIDITGQSFKIISSIIKTINSCQRYYRVDELKTIIQKDITTLNSLLILSFYSPIYNRMFNNNKGDK